MKTLSRVSMIVGLLAAVFLMAWGCTRDESPVVPADEPAHDSSQVGLYHNEILTRYFESRAKEWKYNEEDFRNDFTEAASRVLDVDPETIKPYLDMTIDDSGKLVIWDRDYNGFTPAERFWVAGFYTYIREARDPADLKRLAFDYESTAGIPSTENLRNFFSTVIHSSDYWANHCDCAKKPYDAMVIGMDAWGAIKGGLIGGWIGAIIGSAVQSIAFAVIEPNGDG